jgi:hypothetical protein
MLCRIVRCIRRRIAYGEKCDCWLCHDYDFNIIIREVLNYAKNAPWCKNCLFRTWMLESSERLYQLEYVRQISKDEDTSHLEIEDYDVRMWKIGTCYLLHRAAEFI